MDASPDHPLVVVLGASDKPDRYAYLAAEQLLAQGYRVAGISPRSLKGPGMPVYATLADLREPVDTVTVYINPARLLPLLDDLVALGPRRVILNPGTESEEAASRLRRAGIAVEEACTLVLLRTGQFES